MVVERMRSDILDVTPVKREADERAYLANADALAVAQRFQRVVGPEAYAAFLEEEFNRPLEPTELHRLIVQLPFPYLVTTNFDPLLERAYMDAHGRAPDVCWRYEQIVAASAKGQPYILAIHGSIHDLDSIVFTEDDYARLAVEQHELMARVRTELANRHVLMIGYSLSDPDFRGMYLTTRLLAGHARRQDHAVMTQPRQPDREEWLARGIRFVSLDEHAQLPGFVAEIHRELGRRKRSAGRRGRAGEPALADHRTAYEGPARRLSLRPQDSSDVRGGVIELPEELPLFLEKGARALLLGAPGSGKSYLMNELKRLGGNSVRLISAVSLETDSRANPQWADGLWPDPDCRVLLCDGLDEVTLEFRRPFALQLRDIADSAPDLAAVVASRDVDIPGLPEWEKWDLLAIRPDQASDLLIQQSGGRISGEAASALCARFPDLFARPLFPKLIAEADGLTLPDQPGGVSESYLLMRSVKVALEISDEKFDDLARALSRAWSASRSYEFPRNDLLNNLLAGEPDGYRENLADTTVLLDRLGADTAPFISTGGSFYPRQRALVDVLLARGLLLSGSFSTSVMYDLVRERSWDHLVTLTLDLMPRDQQDELLDDLWALAPRLAIRSLTDLPNFSTELKRVILAGQHEADLVRLVQSLFATEPPSMCVRVADVLTRREYRSGHILYFVVEMLERLRDADTAGYSAQAQELLDRLWRERAAIKLTPELVDIPAGEYEVGCDSGDKDEQPRHSVELGAYSIGRAHVTNEQFLEFNPNYSQSRTSPHRTSPAVDITWYEAMMYCRWCLGNAGRLPTEAEWEVAAQGPSSDGRAFPWGDEFDEARANIDNPRGAATPYDKFPPNDFRLYDMCGNVFDWCLDWYDENSYRSGQIVNPVGPPVGRYRSMRGGSWARPIESGRCAYRVRQVPETRDVLVGFRVASGQKLQTEGAGDEQ